MDVPKPGSGQTRDAGGTPSREPSPRPPLGLEPALVPQFVSFGFDDNGIPGSGGDEGVSWVAQAFGSRRNPAGSGDAATFDGAPCRATFFFSSGYLDGCLPCPDAAALAYALREAAKSGFELANHTRSHPHGSDLTAERWVEEMEACELALSGLVGTGRSPGGFRTPYLEHGHGTFEAVSRMGFAYDASVEEGWRADQDGRNYLWPYTLDRDDSESGPAGAFADDAPPSPRRRRFWELPLHAAIVPPDEACERLGAEPGLRRRIAERKPEFDPSDGKVTGLDWNLLVDYGMDKSEYFATLAHTFDLRIEGNRCPMLFGGHSDIYAESYPGLPRISPGERRAAVEEFLDYALSRAATRIVTYADALSWLVRPVPLH